jgi:CheY-like chemotaxis protein
VTPVTPVTLEEVQEFVKNQHVLIVDPSNSTRKVLKMAMTQLGIPVGNIRATSQFNEAIQYILENPPRIIFTEFKVRDHYGLEFLPYLDQLNIGNLERCFFVVTENSRESAVAEAAEEDVDGYIIKPFSIDSLNKYVLNTLKDKIRPSDYYQQIEIAKKLIEGSRVAEAVIKLEKTAKETTNPSLAYNYLGQCYRILGQKENALKAYRLGLRYQKRHYKCCVGEFEVLDELGQQPEAYAAAKALAADYPLTPNRLGRMITLAVYTRHLDDLPGFFEQFLKIESRTEDLVKIVSASMFVCAKHQLSQNNYANALAFFKRACIVSPNRNELIARSIEIFLGIHRSSEALELYKMVALQDRLEMKWKNLEFRICSLTDNREQLIERGRKLISEGIDTPFVYIKVATAYLEQNRFRHAENIVYEGIKNCPEHRAELLKLIENGQDDQAG